VVEQAAKQLVAIRSLELLRGELADRLEHAEPVRLPAADEALVGKRLELLEIGVADPLRGVDRPAPTEDGQPRQQSCSSAVSRSWDHSMVARSVC
jgi:hypothetical protein